MKHTRIVVTHYGGPDALQVEEECPEPKRGEVRVRVLAAGQAGTALTCVTCVNLSQTPWSIALRQILSLS